jgi:crotonobetainyl-CoA:carnitine CoA-transferase CaiB-like acyl-CoA transferase
MRAWPRGRRSLTPTAPPPALKGLRVIEFTHMVMGPTCGMVLADLGAEVIKIEPPDGDRTRTLLGAGAASSPCSTATRRASARPAPARGRRAARKLCASADVVAENFKPGTMAKYGWTTPRCRRQPAADLRQPQGLPARPLRHRTALDEVVQMMGGLAYMTGRAGDPLRAGTSVNDIMGGMFGAIGVLGALMQRGITGRGMEVQSALFENNVFLVGQHMLQYAMTGKPAAPMPARDNGLGVYDVFTVKDGEQIFLAAVSDAQWKTFCDVLGFADLKADPAWPPTTTACSSARTAASRLASACAAQRGGAVRADGARPACPSRRSAGPRTCTTTHLLASGGLADVRLPDGDKAGETSRPPCCPSPGRRAAGRAARPAALGEHTRELLAGRPGAMRRSTP